MAVIRRQAVKVVAPGQTRYQAHTDNVMLVVFEFHKQAVQAQIPPHSHPHEQVSYVAAGSLRYLVGRKWDRLEAGDMVTIPPNIPHTVDPLSDHVTLVDAFHPVREDFVG